LLFKLLVEGGQALFLALCLRPQPSKEAAELAASMLVAAD
jgi:hypothetical protein